MIISLAVFDRAGQRKLSIDSYPTWHEFVYYICISPQTTLPETTDHHLT